MRAIRPIAILAALLFTAGSAAAQQHEHAPVKVGKDTTAAATPMEHMSGWKELDAYHTVMMQVWHPAKQQNDLAPIRAQATKLADAGDALAKSSVPHACDTPANREAMSKVQGETRALASLVASGSDTQVKDALKALHDRFETLNHACKAGHH